MYNIRIQLVCILLGISGTVFSNENDSTAIQTQQNELSNFYIADDGSVSNEGLGLVDSAGQKAEAITVAVVDTATISKTEDLFFFSKEKKADISKDLMTDEVSRNENDVVVEKKDENPVAVTSVHSAVPIPVEIKYSGSSLSDSVVAESAVNEDYVVKNDKIPERSVFDEKESSVQEEAGKDDEEYVPSYRREPSYKSLEEATLASDRLLAQLKKQQGQRGQSVSKSGSLSSRVVRGGDYVRSTARNDQASNGRANGVADDFDYETDFGNEPTYYINGVRVEKSDVLRLRKKNILSRTMKLKETASRNPNGEIWYEVKE